MKSFYLPVRRFVFSLAAAAAFIGLVPSLQSAEKPHVVLISGEYEYSSMITLPALAAYLEENHGFKTTYLQRGNGENIDGLEALESADLAILMIRRMTLPPDQLGRIRSYVEKGGPVVGLRTTSHAFENWKAWDNEVLGGNYHGHHKNHLVATAHVPDSARRHPIMQGVKEAFLTGGSLYETVPLAKGTTLLLNGTVEGAEPEPAAWTHEYRGARIFYASLGDAKDFASQPFMQMLVRATHWAMDRPQPKKPAKAIKFFPSRVIDTEAFEKFAKHHRTQVLDVRTPGEFRDGHVAKAWNIDFSAPDFKEKVGKLDRNRPYALHCRSGGRSGRATKLMKQMGFKFLYDYSGSMLDWEAADKPLVEGDK
jgi:rhodanese-related sulfurtransferase/type 1 glutamine amidotransferase